MIDGDFSAHFLAGTHRRLLSVTAANGALTQQLLYGDTVENPECFPVSMQVEGNHLTFSYPPAMCQHTLKSFSLRLCGLRTHSVCPTVYDTVLMYSALQSSSFVRNVCKVWLFYFFIFSPFHTWYLIPLMAKVHLSVCLSSNELSGVNKTNHHCVSNKKFKQAVLVKN